MEESWKDVLGYEGCYQISSFGRLMGFPRHNWKVGGIRKWFKMKNGYLVYSLHKDGVHIKILVHRLVAKTFIPNPENKPEVNHLDGNKENNHVSNLEWATPSENMKHSFDTGLNDCREITKRGSEHHEAKPLVMLDKRTLQPLKIFECISDAIEYFGKPRDNGGAISCAAKGLYKTSNKHKWEYL